MSTEISVPHNDAFEVYSAYVVDLKVRNGLKAKTASIYRTLLKRINAELGPLKVQDIRPDHLNRFYAKLAEPGQRKDKDRAKPRKNIGTWLEENGVSQQALAKRAHVGHTSVGAALQGECIYITTAEKISQAMGGTFNDYFTVEKSKDTVLFPKTILEHYRVISTVLEQAVKEQLVPDNAAKRATPPKLPKHEMEAFELEEIRDILTALEEEPLKWQVCTQLLIATGARRGEIMGLRWKNVDCYETGCVQDTSNIWEVKEQLYCNAYHNQGIKVFLHRISGELYQLRVRIEPCRVLGDAVPTALFQPDKWSYRQMVKSVDKLLKNLKVPCSIDNMKISRCDLTANIEFSGKEELMEYLRILKKSLIIPRYKYVYFEKRGQKVNDWKIANAHSHCLSCKSASFLIYDKVAQLEMIDRCDETLL